MGTAATIRVRSVLVVIDAIAQEEVAFLNRRVAADLRNIVNERPLGTIEPSDGADAGHDWLLSCWKSAENETATRQRTRLPRQICNATEPLSHQRYDRRCRSILKSD